MADKKGAVVRQASFLMAAQMISSVIGLLYKSPLHVIMGDVGDGYYQFAQEWYTIILLISSYSIPSAVSKVMAERLAVHQYKNANRVFRAALIYVTVVGLIGGLVAYFGAPFFLQESQDAVLALRILAPTIFLSGFLGCMRGFFQAHNTMKPTAISQIAEQFLNAAVSVLAAYLLTRPYLGQENLRARYGAAGGTIGTSAGVLTGLLIMLAVFLVNRKLIGRRIRKDRHRNVEPYREVFRDIFLMVTPIILATCVYNLSSVVDQRIFASLLTAKEVPSETIASQYGLFSYRCKTIINIPIALASATSTALIPAVASSIAEKKQKDAAEKINECIRLILFLAVPSAFGIAILSYPVMLMLYPSGDVRTAAVLLSCGAVSVRFYSLSTVTNGVLQGLGHPGEPVKNAALGLVMNVLTVYLLVGWLDIGVYGVLAATVVYSFSVMILNGFAVRKHFGMKVGTVRAFFAPLRAAVIMGIGVAAVYWGPRLLFPQVFGRYLVSAVLTLAAVLAGVLIYFVTYLKMTGMTDAEIRKLPMGTRMLSLLRKLHLR